MASHSDLEVPAVVVMYLQEDCLFVETLLSAHDMPLDHGAQTTAVHDTPEPVFLF